jgi:hypothetical protein
LGSALTVEAGREPNRKLAVSYSWFSPRYCGRPKKDKVEIKVCYLYS